MQNSSQAVAPDGPDALPWRCGRNARLAWPVNKSRLYIGFAGSWVTRKQQLPLYSFEFQNSEIARLFVSAREKF
jgi:hypothetical protein